MTMKVAMLFVVISSQAASAQTTTAKTGGPFFDSALNRLGVYLTAPVADQYRRASAAKFSEGAAQAGFSHYEATVLTNSMLTGDIRIQPGGKWGKFVAKNPDIVIDAEPGQTKGRYLSSFLSVDTTTSLLERFSTIKLVVKPVPPRDYKVIVNGEECPATEAGVYKVLPGESMVNAVRTGRPKCEWHGPIAPGATQEVDCSF